MVWPVLRRLCRQTGEVNHTTTYITTMLSSQLSVQRVFQQTLHKPFLYPLLCGRLGVTKVGFYESTWHHVLVLGGNPSADEQRLSHLTCLTLFEPPLLKVGFALYQLSCFFCFFLWGSVKRDIRWDPGWTLAPLGRDGALWRNNGPCSVEKCRANKGVAWLTDLLWRQGEAEALHLKENGTDVRFYQVNKPERSTFNW